MIKASWPAPACVRAYTTTRGGGASKNAFNSFNLATHVGDEPQDVYTNRSLLKKKLNLPNDPAWLNQTHSIQVVTLSHRKLDLTQPADAVITRHRGQVCAILTADCLPILLCNDTGTEIASIHAGWRGLASGIINQTIAAMHTPAHRLMAWIGPAIGPHAFEIGADVRDTFIHRHADFASGFIQIDHTWKANLFELAKINLARLHVNAVYCEEYCTFSNPQQFFSYRFSKGQTGRMASLIWME